MTQSIFDFPGHTSANTRPHQPCWGDREMRMAVSHNKTVTDDDDVGGTCCMWVHVGVACVQTHSSFRLKPSAMTDKHGLCLQQANTEGKTQRDSVARFKLLEGRYVRVVYVCNEEGPPHLCFAYCK